MALFDEDQGWYRGIVAEIGNENQQATIVYVDYGNQGKQPLDQLLTELVENTVIFRSLFFQLETL